MKIELDEFQNIYIELKRGATVTQESVNKYLLYEIIMELRKLRSTVNEIKKYNTPNR